MIKRTMLIKDILWFFVLWGLVAGVFRMWFGLGATTNLTDAVPWGMWKILNMVAGVALSTSGFTVGFLVVVLKIERFRPLLKPAILVAFLGYGCSCLALLFDIGLPHRFWHPLLMWNEHSFLFEVFWCVLLYFTVTSIELIPNILERFRSEKIIRLLHKISFAVVVIGISLSSLHHSSLGSLFLVTPERLHGLWYSSLLPLFFIMSAMGGGMMFVVLVRILYARWYDPEPVFGPIGEKSCSINGRGNAAPPPPPGRDMPMLKGLAIIAAFILGAYALLKAGDLVLNGSWRALAAGTWESYLFAFEMLIAAVIPVILVANPRTRNSPFGLGIASFSAAAGLALNRVDVGIFGYFRDAGTTYFPSLAEWAVGFGVVAAAGLAFFFFVENFTIFDESWKTRTISKGIFKASYDTLLRVWNAVLVSGLHRVTLIAVFTIPVAWVLMYPPYSRAGTQEETVQPSVGLDVMRANLRIDGNRRGVFTEFPHADHQKRLGGESSCATCHHISLPGDKSTPCFRCHRNIVRPTDIFDHFNHMKLVASKEELSGLHPANHSCTHCHEDGRPKTTGSSRTCLACHEEDMWTPGTTAGEAAAALQEACSYQEAMHRVCITCHREKQSDSNRADLGDCSTCHPSKRIKPGESPAVADS